MEIPAGTFLIDAPLRVDLPALGYRGIRGANGATRIVMSGPGPALEILGDHQGTAFPPSVEEHTWEKERFPVISGLEIVGKHPEADGIALCRTMKCTIQNVLIRQCRYGIRLVERNRNVIIADSHIYDCTDTGVFLDNCNLHQTNIIGNHISYNLRAGIRQWRGDVHNVQITGNDIEYNYDREAADDEAAADNADNAEVTSGEIVLESPDTLISEYTIVSNTIQARPESPGANILILGSEADTPHAARTIAISGNIIGSRDKNIVLSHACRTTISGNTIYGGKVLNIEARHCQNVILSANNIGSRPSMHAGSVIYCDGILLEECSDCLLDGNIVSNHRFGSPGIRRRHHPAQRLPLPRLRLPDCRAAIPGRPRHRRHGLHRLGQRRHGARSRRRLPRGHPNLRRREKPPRPEQLDLQRPRNAHPHRKRRRRIAGQHPGRLGASAVIANDASLCAFCYTVRATVNKGGPPMEQERFVIEVDGRHVAVDPAKGRVSLLDARGEEVTGGRIQTAAGSLQGIFSMLEDVTGVKHA